MIRILMFSALSLAMTLISASAEARVEGTFRDWTVRTKTVGGEKICFAITKPKTMAPKSVKHGDIYFMIANWKSGKALEQPSLFTGYPLKPDRPTIARVGSTKIPMFADANEAFVEQRSDEKKLIGKMKKGSTMRVDAVSARGTRTSYEFSLRGVTAALQKARAACR
ncbi:MAG TPA: hypothetical protein ENK01_00015 [Hellea balneolensis]|uniref:Invasion associated locus B family protein n=1 Tax=Hellea balneolensis TaxID=287478 RepID=A0A7V5NW40_9PROT|nr:hypothetical protein [Hellea balneolensis]